MDAFVAAVADRTAGATDAAGALEPHLLAFVAEEARVTGGVIDVTARRTAGE